MDVELTYNKLHVFKVYNIFICICVMYNSRYVIK